MSGLNPFEELEEHQRPSQPAFRRLNSLEAPETGPRVTDDTWESHSALPQKGAHLSSYTTLYTLKVLITYLGGEAVPSALPPKPPDKLSSGFGKEWGHQYSIGLRVLKLRTPSPRGRRHRQFLTPQ